MAEFTRTTYSLTFYDSVVVIELDRTRHPKRLQLAAFRFLILCKMSSCSRRALEDDDLRLQIHVANPDLDRPAISPVHVDTQVVIDPTGPPAQIMLAGAAMVDYARVSGEQSVVRIGVALGQVSRLVILRRKTRGPVALSVTQRTITVWLERRVRLAEWAGVDRVAAKWSAAFGVGELFCAFAFGRPSIISACLRLGWSAFMATRRGARLSGRLAPATLQEQSAIT